MKCEICGKATKELYADTYFNEEMCEDCYSKYDHNTNPKAEEQHEVAFYKKIFTFKNN